MKIDLFSLIEQYIVETAMEHWNAALYIAPLIDLLSNRTVTLL